MTPFNESCLFDMIVLAPAGPVHAVLNQREMLKVFAEIRSPLNSVFICWSEEKATALSGTPKRFMAGVMEFVNVPV